MTEEEKLLLLENKNDEGEWWCAVWSRKKRDQDKMCLNKTSREQRYCSRIFNSNSEKKKLRKLWLEEVATQVAVVGEEDEIKKNGNKYHVKIIIVDNNKINFLIDI